MYCMYCVCCVYRVYCVYSSGRYFIVPATNDHVLAVNKETGQVTIDNPPDYEAFPSGTAPDDRCHSMTVSGDGG